MRPPVARALKRDGLRDRGPRAQLVERERELAADAAAEAQAPHRGVHDGDVVVDEQVVQAGRREVVGERLERQPVVAGGELELVGGDPPRRVDAGQLLAQHYAPVRAARIAALCARLPAWYSASASAESTSPSVGWPGASGSAVATP